MYLITGCAGFIGMHLAKKILENNNSVIGIDNLNNHYDEGFKKKRLNVLKKFKKFKFIKADISEKKKILKIFSINKPKIVIHLAAQAGVRYSLINPDIYLKSNLIGFFNILEACKKIKTKALIFASSSSVYGSSKKKVFTEKDNTDKSQSFYAATKKSNEVMAYSYHHLYGLNMIGLRFFTVYGPWNRPDMATFKFMNRITKKQKIDIYADGRLKRDFTYIDDIITSIEKLIKKSSHKKNNFFEIFNIGNNKPIKVLSFVKKLEKISGKKAKKNFTKKPKTELKMTNSNSQKLYKYIKFKPHTSIDKGLKNFYTWFKNSI